MQETDPRENARYPEEIDLVDIWLVVVRHKWWLIGVTLLCIALAVAYAALRTPKYEYAATLEIGGYWAQSGEEASSFSGRYVLYEEPQTVVAKIKGSYGLTARLSAIETHGKANVPGEIVAKAEKGTQTVELLVTASEGHGDIARELLNGVTGQVIKDHRAIMQDRADLLSGFLKERVEELDQQIADLRQSRRDVVRNGSSETKALAMLLTDSRLQQLEAERARLRRELEVGLQTDLKPTRVITGPVRKPEPAGLGTLLILVLGGVIGMVLGFVAVMFRQILQSARERRESLS